MAYAAQLKKHHARFQAAVLRNLFDSPTPPPPASAPAPTSSRTSEILIDALPPNPDHGSIQSEYESTQMLRDEICFHEAPQTTEPDSHVTEDFCDSKETKITKPFLTRSQQRRLKLKKLKESLVESGERKRFVGPLLPISMDMEHGQSLCDSIGAVEAENRDTKEYQFQAGLNTCIDLEYEKEEELCKPGTHMEISAETDGCDTRVSLSRTKKRRLAKKKWSSDVSRHLQQGSIFTAEIKGESFIIKKV